MLTKSDLQAIKDIVVTNNNILGTIFKADLEQTKKDVRSEFAKTNKRIDTLAQDTKELKKGFERLELKIDKLDYEERINRLEQRMAATKTAIKSLRAKTN